MKSPAIRVGMRVRAVKDFFSGTHDFNDVPSKKYGSVRSIKTGDEFVILEVKGMCWYAKDLGVWANKALPNYFIVAPNEEDLSMYEELFV